MLFVFFFGFSVVVCCLFYVLFVYDSVVFSFVSVLCSGFFWFLGCFVSFFIVFILCCLGSFCQISMFQVRVEGLFRK